MKKRKVSVIEKLAAMILVNGFTKGSDLLKIVTTTLNRRLVQFSSV